MRHHPLNPRDLNLISGELSDLKHNLDSRVCSGFTAHITDKDELTLTPDITRRAQKVFSRPVLQDMVIKRLFKLAGEMPEGSVTTSTEASHHVLAFDSTASLQQFVRRANSVARRLHEAKQTSDIFI